MQVLIDGDILTYRVGFACQKTEYYIPDTHRGTIKLGHKKGEAKRLAIQHGYKIDDIHSELVVDPIEHCLHSVKIVVESIIVETKASSFRLFLTGSNNFREHLVDYYKMNRKDAKKPHYYQEIRDYLMNHWDGEMNEDQEADDALSIAQWPVWKNTLDKTTCIATIDKDLKNTPGWNYNFVKKEMIFIDEDQANLNFYAQLITGDMTDNIPGLYQITGTKALAKYLEPLAYCDTIRDMWMYVVTVYHEAFCKIDSTLDGDDWVAIEEAIVVKLKETGILLWMRREEGEYWCPPT